MSSLIVRVKDLKGDELIRCVRCGEALTSLDIEIAVNDNEPPACNDCRPEVMEEIAKDYSMWPNDWYGHSYKRRDGIWMTGREV